MEPSTNLGISGNSKSDPSDIDPDIDEVTIDSMQKGSMDYISLNNIIKRIGIDKKHAIAFIVKELLDNAVDYVETFGRNSDSDPVIRFEITNEKIIISNTNLQSKRNSFNLDKLNSIFAFDSTFSSKANLYKITKGYMGDALKEVLSIPYALARDLGKKWNEPLIIKYDDKTYKIKPVINRSEPSIKPDIKVQPRNDDSDETVIEVSLPTMTEQDQNVIWELILDYVILNPHITFDIHVFDFDKLNHFLPRTENLNPNWRNPPSIHYYTLPEFEDLIYGLKNKNANAYQIFKEFREGTNLRSNELDFTIGELQQDQKKISELYQKLLDLIPTVPTLETPFEIRKRNRHKEAIRKRVEQLGYIVSDIKYRYAYESTTLEDHPEVRFPFIFEIAILNIVVGVYRLRTVDGINSSSRVGNPFMTKYIDGYSWLPVGADNYKHASNLEDILEEYGYSRDSKKSRKPDSMIIANLISPRIQYRSYGKSQIDLDPFVDVIAETTYKICTLGTKPSNITNKNSTIRNATEALTKILSDRLDAINKNPETKITDPWTQSTVFYYTRKLMKDLEIEDRSRKHVTNSIRIVCDRLKTTREELGIYAADRAQLYFRGQWHSVGYNEIGNLMKKGTDLIIVEKEGAALLLGQYADQSGIAFLNTRGFLTEYARAVSVLAEKHGANVVILTDLDSSGLLIRYAVPNVPRVGIDFETLEILGIDQTDVDEEYDPGKHIARLEFNAEQDEELELTLSRLKQNGKHKRIEIDTVIAAAGNEIFWNFLKSKLEELFPNRDYNRAIQVPEYVMPIEVEDLIAKLENKGIEVAGDEHSKIKDELKNIEGFIDNITEKESEISDRIKKTISESKEIGPILPEITKLIEKYDFLK